MDATLSFAEAVRQGERFKDGRYKSPRKFFDVIVNGFSMWERLGKPHDMVSVLCVDFLPQSLLALERLMLRIDSELPDNRRSLFVCSEGYEDVGCGVISLSVKTEGSKVLWTDFGYENNYENARLDSYRDVGPFRFDRLQYEAALQEVAAQLKY